MNAKKLIESIHASPVRVLLLLTGGGSRAIAKLLEVPGASRTLLEAIVPYSQNAMSTWLGDTPQQCCSCSTARHMAMVAMLRARHLEPDDSLVMGVACTASLATDRPKRGPHRVHLALQSLERTTTWSLELQKGYRTRRQEEKLVARLLLNMTAEACGIEDRLKLPTLDTEELIASKTVAPRTWQDLLQGRVLRVRHQHNSPEQPSTAQLSNEKTPALFPGAFNPVHRGHRAMLEVAQQILGMPVAWELSIVNVDKPPLDYFEIQQRVDQLPNHETLWLTLAPTFEEKSRLFPGATFVVGIDTLQRIGDARYYGNNPAACQVALEQIAQCGCQFLVFGRSDGSRFKTMDDLDLPEVLRSLCRMVPGDQFREDISSTEIRRTGLSS